MERREKLGPLGQRTMAHFLKIVIQSVVHWWVLPFYSTGDQIAYLYIYIYISSDAPSWIRALFTLFTHTVSSFTTLTPLQLSLPRSWTDSLHISIQAELCTRFLPHDALHQHCIIWYQLHHGFWHCIFHNSVNMSSIALLDDTSWDVAEVRCKLSNSTLLSQEIP